MTPQEKILSVERQIHDMVQNEAPFLLSCPYCGLDNTANHGALCCNELATVVEAIIDFRETRDQLEIVNRVMERLEKIAQN